MSASTAAIAVRLLGALSIAALGGCGSGSGSGANDADSAHWVATWYGAPFDAAKSVRNVTYRLMVHDAIAGKTVRLRFSNRYGTAPLKLSKVSIALPSAVLKLPPVDAATVTPVLFNQSAEVVIPAGEDARSDPVAFDLPADSDIAVTFYVPDTVANVTSHTNALTTSWSTGNGGGDASDDAAGTAFTSLEPGWNFLTGLEVIAPQSTTTVVAFGDSITDGGFEVPNFDTRWPDLLNDRIAGSDLAGLRSVVNAGISGNMITADRGGNATQGQAAVTRMAWDVFDQPNVSHVIVYEGINDVGENVQAPDILAGVQTIIDAAHRRGIKVVMATLTPCFGAASPGNLKYTTNESQRYPVNDWVRAGAGFDGVIDFDGVVSNGLMPELWLSDLTVDYLHPNPLGLMVMANAIPLDVLR